ncbi:MAG: bifunctional 3-deoxy-7-phosphoheptulonate synthase/chorismate mutase type II [Bacteroidales bacterium]|nr:bifunctional 3-deoxy-7-phosphoheptulonate synthase/chorismate mutase type II [Bacteroidales bacterium]
MSINLDTDSFYDSFNPIDPNFPLIIAGPCSAETRHQVISTASQIASLNKVTYYRAGLWKPRTRPDGFEGLGEKALPWLAEAKALTGLKMAVEVAMPSHVELSLKAGIDLLWIGARTTANPFSVQEIAEALQGVDIPVLVKNPLHPDLKLWIGALERINKAGVRKLGAVHRGFYTYDNGPFRNLPMWELPIELKRLNPDLPVITDPSHISGKRSLVAEVAQKALDLAMDGLMIESHFHPNHAKTDANQQLTPASLSKILNKLNLRQEFGTEDFESILTEIRREIDHIDSELLQILSRRMEKIEGIGRIKMENNITILQIERLRQMMISRLKTGKELGLDSAFILKLLQLVHKESIQVQTKLLTKKPNNGDL